MTMSPGHAQYLDGMIAQPTHIVGKRINADGEVTRILESDFTYSEDGKPQTFTIPEYELSTYYEFEGAFFMQERTYHNNGHPQLEEQLTYTYENGKVSSIEHYWSDVEPWEFWAYSYGDDGRLARIDFSYDAEFATEFHNHFIFEYENDGKTKIKNYWTSWPSHGWLLRQKTVYQYDDEYNLLSTQIEDYSVEGELTGSTLDTYTYTTRGKLETQVTQTLVEGEWVNSHIMHYVYDYNDQALEQQDGSWSAENNCWDIDHKVVFDLSIDGSTYTVSFYKKNGEDWVWDVFDNQTILFGDALKNQQRTLRFFQRETYNGQGNINQFEISLIYTEEPVYLVVNDNTLAKCSIYPNPTTGFVTITGENLRQAEVLNVLGQKLLSIQGEGNELRIDLARLPAGVYFVNVTDNEGKKCVRKVVRE